MKSGEDIPFECYVCKSTKKEELEARKDKTHGILLNESKEVIENVVVVENKLTFVKQSNSSKRNKDILIDSFGYKYSVKERYFINNTMRTAIY